MTQHEDLLIEAQMHAECLNEAWCELKEYFVPITPERREVVEAEISSRIWAVILLVQQQRTGGNLSDDAKAAIREANAYNGMDDEPSQDGFH